MSGFGNVFGIMFSFIVISSIFLGAFYVYHNQIALQAKSLEIVQKEALDNAKSNFDIISYYEDSGRLNFIIKNTGTQDILLKNKNSDICFSFFLNNQFIPIREVKISTLNPIIYDYRIIEKNSLGIISFPAQLDYTKGNTFRIVSCAGVTKEYTINSTKKDWVDIDFFKRLEFTIENRANTNLAEYQAQITLNSSIFDFDYINNDIRFYIPLKETLVLDLSFDNYNQEPQDYSKYNQYVTLGNNDTQETKDPNILVNSPIFNGLDFDGNNDFVKVVNDEALLLENELTYSAFIKWDTLGNNMQNIITNGNPDNALVIVNDGGLNDNKLLFELNIEGSLELLYSNITLDDKWHLISGTYDGVNMKLYIDDYLVGINNVSGKVDSSLATNYIGSQTDSNDFFEGSIDEVKIFNIALSQDEIKDILYNKIGFRELDYYISSWDISNEKANIFVKIPFVASLSNVTIHMYSGYQGQTLNSKSSISDTFSYKLPRTVGYIVHDRISSDIGLSIFSLQDNNEIIIGSNSLNLNYKQSDSLSSSDLNPNDEIQMKYLAQIEGSGQGGDIIVPISWASDEFSYGGLTSSIDRLCLLSPWGNADVHIFEDGNSKDNETVDSNGVCVDLDISSGNNMRISSDIPIFAYIIGDDTKNSISLYPMQSDTIYGVPCESVYIASGLGNLANGILWGSEGSVSDFSINSEGIFTDTYTGSNGVSNALKIVPNSGLISAIQEDDSDSEEASVFASQIDMGTLFGSAIDADYISLVSPYENANCSVYDSSNFLVGNVPYGTGSNGVYKYDFGTGNNNLYVNGGWTLECQRPVWGYYEKSNEQAETNLFGYMQMRQYVYPQIVVNVVS